MLSDAEHSAVKRHSQFSSYKGRATAAKTGKSLRTVTVEQIFLWNYREVKIIGSKKSRMPSGGFEPPTNGL